MDRRSWVSRWFLPQPRRDHSEEIAKHIERASEAEAEVHTKARELRAVLEEFAERKRGQNDA